MYESMRRKPFLFTPWGADLSFINGRLEKTPGKEERRIWMERAKNNKI